MFRAAAAQDIPAVAQIYADIIAREGETPRTGWLPGVYPTGDTAAAALARGELFVYEENGAVLAAGILNQTQVDVYALGHWQYPAPPEEVMVLHTLVVSPAASGRGLGRRFVGFYEDYARTHGCTVARLDTNAINLPARALYGGLGYREAGVVPCDFNGIPGVSLVLLEKKLP